MFMATNSNCFQGPRNTHLLVHLRLPQKKKNPKKRERFQFGNKMTRHLLCSVAQFQLPHTYCFHLVFSVLCGVNENKQQMETCVTQCKHQDYVDEVLCTTGILLDFFFCYYTSDMHANAPIYIHNITSIKAVAGCSSSSNPMSGDFLSSRSQIHVFISIPIDSIVFSCVSYYSLFSLSLSLITLPPMSVSCTN